MPRDSQGTHSLPSGTLVNSGDTVLPSQHNPAMQDLSDGITNSVDRDGKGGMRAELNMGGYRVKNAAAGVDPDDLATVAQASMGAAASIPVGIVLDYAGATAPNGYLMCFGQAISRAAYSALFTAIGTTYGAGDGSTTFNLPDARGRVTAGKDNMGGSAANRLTAAVAVDGSTLGAVGGSQSHTLTTAQLAAHTHTGNTANDGVHSHSLNGGWAGLKVDSGGSPGSTNVGTAITETTSTDGAHVHAFTTAAAGDGDAHNNTQPTIVFNKIIRAGTI